jgi:hypothetical protein
LRTVETRGKVTGKIISVTSKKSKHWMLLNHTGIMEPASQDNHSPGAGLGTNRAINHEAAKNTAAVKIKVARSPAATANPAPSIGATALAIEVTLVSTPYTAPWRPSGDRLASVALRAAIIPPMAAPVKNWNNITWAEDPARP